MSLSEARKLKNASFGEKMKASFNKMGAGNKRKTKKLERLHNKRLKDK